mgnify:FL=1
MDSATKKSIYEAIKNESTKQVKEQLKQYFNTLNHRIQRLESSGYTNVPAYLAMQKSGGRFTIGHKNLAELSKEFSRAQSFEKAKTSTVSYAKSYIEKQAEQFAKTIKYEIGDEKAYNVFRTIVNMLKERKDVQQAILQLKLSGEEVYKFVEQNTWNRIVNETESETEREASYILSQYTDTDIEAAVDRYALAMTEEIAEIVDDKVENVTDQIRTFTGF